MRTYREPRSWREYMEMSGYQTAHECRSADGIEHRLFETQTNACNGCGWTPGGSSNNPKTTKPRLLRPV